ncbi:tRNA pseudouridine(55) synthase TruB [bacterium]|uniref:tRNA pseudouridine(55) synthase TruB n=1 Tax=Lachnospiraceae TaxID=186803 RepID=UPI002A2FFA69|nr:tRNA pseudouridine(55) synthase TruB [bacterium]MDD6514964.1 tRNA pseudouridine(55) synthase TruB [bacterium]MDD7143490.1 tRNA pseudouridine(55) synthase TruB [bacterium]MDY4504000.1 tRNA pseudouridine(55) synthase TruB [Bariatricus sp.]MDY5457543.1 tRNA pseudouridine(55) synthase TruB [Bariatricus sp.]
MIHGVLNIYKEKGYTSHDVVARLRRIVGQKKIGHTGTLDPEAEGVLPVCLGKATKLCDLLTDKDKTYEAVLLLGISTDTQDTTGKILEEKNTADLREEAVREVVLSFEGEYDQIPPMFSALKVGGKKLYELARDGKEVERKPRHVQIYRIRILQIDLPRVRMEVTCSKGTYIRTLCHDIGEKLGCGGCMESLLRTRVERFGVAESLRISEVEQLMDEGTLQEHMIKVDEMFPDYQKVYLTPEASAAVRNGNSFRLGDVIWISELSGFQNAERVRVYDEERNFIAVYEFEKENQLFKIVKMFFDKKEK